MKKLRDIPLLRIFHRLYIEISKPAPLNNFDNYDEYWESRVNDGRVHRHRDRFTIISNLIRHDESVLDIGCGDGSFQKHLMEKHPSCRSLGVDTSAAAIERLHHQNINALQISPQMRLKEQIGEHWDVITMMEVIEHIVDAEDLMHQVMEMNPSRIFITIPNVGCIKHRLRLMFGGRFPITSIFYHMKEHVRFWTVKDFKQWSKAMGLHIISIHGQFDQGDKLVKFVVKKWPTLFADRVVYELTKKPN